jgi:hypothetical protein
MTDQEINAAIAEACDIVAQEKWGPIYKTPHGWVVECPQFATDLNAMHEAEKYLPIKKILTYFKKLEKSTDYWFMATARQRAEAFLKTLGKWEEAE